MSRKLLAHPMATIKWPCFRQIKLFAVDDGCEGCVSRAGTTEAAWEVVPEEDDEPLKQGRGGTGAQEGMDFGRISAGAGHGVDSEGERELKARFV